MDETAMLDVGGRATSGLLTPRSTRGLGFRGIGRRRTLAALTLVLLVAVSLLLLVAAPAQATRVSVSNLSITLWQDSNGNPWWDITRFGWRFAVSAGSVTVSANKPVKTVIRAYPQNDGWWALGSDTVAPQNGKSGALEASFLGVPQSPNGGVYTVTGITGHEYTDPTPGNQHPDESYGWTTWYRGYWLVVYQDGDFDRIGNAGSMLGMRLPCYYTLDPVNTSTGNATYSETDVALPGKGRGLAFERTYNSLGASTTGAVGYGWNHTYAMRLIPLSAGAVTMVYGDGHEVTFIPASGGTYKQPENTEERLVKNANGTYTAIFADRTLYDFSSAGRLESLTDRYGNCTTLTYDGNGFLTEVEDPGGRSLTFGYSGSNISTITDSANQTVTYGTPRV